MLLGGVLHGMRPEDWVVLLVAAVGVAYLLAVFGGAIVEWWRRG